MVVYLGNVHTIQCLLLIHVTTLYTTYHSLSLRKQLVCAIIDFWNRLEGYTLRRNVGRRAKSSESGIVLVEQASRV